MIATISSFIKENLKIHSNPSTNRRELTILSNYINDNFNDFDLESAKKLVEDYGILYYIIENSELIENPNGFRGRYKNNTVISLLLDAYRQINDLDKKEEISDVNIKTEYCKSLNNIQETDESDDELFKKYNQGDLNARELLINRYLYFAYWFVIKKYSKCISNDTDLMDLIQVANVTLLKAIDHYDYTMKCKFTSYLSIAIEHTLNSYLKIYKDVIKRNAEVENKIRALYRESEKFLLENGYFPSLEELAKYTNKTLIEVQTIMSCDIKTESLEGIKEENLDNEEIINEFAVYDSFYDEAEKGLVAEFLWDTIDASRLTPQEKTVLRLKYLYGYTYVKIAEVLHVTHQRINQIHDNAIKTLRINKYICSLKK